MYGQKKQAYNFDLLSKIMLCTMFKWQQFILSRIFLRNPRRTTPQNWSLKELFAQKLSSIWLFAASWLQPPRLLCPWDSTGKNTTVGSHVLLQGIFPTKGLKDWTASLMSLAFASGFFTTRSTWEALSNYSQFLLWRSNPMEDIKSHKEVSSKDFWLLETIISTTTPKPIQI